MKPKKVNMECWFLQEKKEVISNLSTCRAGLTLPIVSLNLLSGEQTFNQHGSRESMKVFEKKK